VFKPALETAPAFFMPGLLHTCTPLHTTFLSAVQLKSRMVLSVSLYLHTCTPLFQHL
jgi:hypothetical protein